MMMSHEVLFQQWRVIGTKIFYLTEETYLLMVGVTYTNQDFINFLKSIFGEHLISEYVASNNGLQFDIYSFRQFARDCKFDCISSSQKYTQDNGFSERNIQSVKTQ